MNGKKRDGGPSALVVWVVCCECGTVEAADEGMKYKAGKEAGRAEGMQRVCFAHTHTHTRNPRKRARGFVTGDR